MSVSKITKEQLEYYKNTYDRYEGIESNEFEKICDELIEYKLLEEELNFDLEIVIKALLNGIYCTHSTSERNYFSGKELSISGDHEALVVYENNVYWITKNGERIKQQQVVYKRFEFKDYSKTWSLSRNDLEEQEDDRN